MEITGVRLWWTMASLCLGLLLSSLESTIVSTALISIGSDFNNLQQSNWIVISYLLTYSSFLIIFARLSDITGRKSALITSLCFFGVSSLACGLARTMTQLIVFRAFQGIGGSGVYALTMVIVSEASPSKHVGLISGILNSVFVLASAVGPIIGGAIATYTTWRWCFFFNVPGTAIVVAAISFMYPSSVDEPSSTLRTLSKRVDWVGLLLCLAASIVIIVPIQEGGMVYAWNNGVIIALLAIGAFCWAAFACWETWLAKMTGERVVLPMVPHQAVIHRVIGACIVNAFLTGIVFSSIVIYLPQRFQAVNALSPVDAGEKVLPFLLVSAFAAVFSGVTLSKKNWCSYYLIAGTSFQVLGLALQSTLPTSVEVPRIAYFYQALLGIGTGTSLLASFVLARIEIPHKEHIAALVGCITQLRVFGGVVGVVICRVSQDAYLRENLSTIVAPQVVDQLMSSMAAILKLSVGESLAVRQVYGGSFNQQHRILTYIAAVNLVISLLTLRKHALPLTAVVMPADSKTTNAVEGADLEQGTELREVPQSARS